MFSLKTSNNFKLWTFYQNVEAPACRKRETSRVRRRSGDREDWEVRKTAILNLKPPGAIVKDISMWTTCIKWAKTCRTSRQVSAPLHHGRGLANSKMLRIYKPVVWREEVDRSSMRHSGGVSGLIVALGFKFRKDYQLAASKGKSVNRYHNVKSLLVSFCFVVLVSQNTGAV